MNRTIILATLASVVMMGQNFTSLREVSGLRGTKQSAETSKQSHMDVSQGDCFVAAGFIMTKVYWAPRKDVQTKNTNMDNKDFTATILVDQSPETAFNAIKNFRAWWSEDIEGKTDQLNETFFYHYKDVHLCKLKLIEMVPNEKLVYLVVDNEFNFVKDKTEWVNTKLIFEITKEGEKTKVKFTHEGLVPAYECYNVCHDAWTGYIQGSLQSLITTGKGKPNGKEGGLNAELVKKWGLPDK